MDHAVDDRRTTRRGALGGSLLGLAGVVGLVDARPASATAQAPEEVLRFDGRRWRMKRAADGSGTATGELLVRGEAVGEFVSNWHAPRDQLGGEHHTLNLADGTILGMGAAAADPEAENAFAIVGGTGRYEGVTGSYVLRQSPVEMGGDGTAEVTMRLDRRGTSGGR